MTSPSRVGVAWDPAVLDRDEEGQAVAAYKASRRRSSSYGTYSRAVVVAVDGSDHARRAFEWYVMNVWKNEDFVVLVHCPETPKLPTFAWKSGIAPPIDEWKKILGDMNNNTKKIEEDFQTVCTSKKMKFKLRAEAKKNVGEGIIRIATDESADLIVMGSKGTGASTFVNKGTVAEFVSRHSPIPTLIIPSS